VVVRFLEALAATQRSFTQKWHLVVYALTPEWLTRHHNLVHVLKSVGVTHQYDLQEVERFKRHIVETRSDPLWRQAMIYRNFLHPAFLVTGILCLVTIVSGAIAAMYFLGAGVIALFLSGLKFFVYDLLICNGMALMAYAAWKSFVKIDDYDHTLEVRYAKSGNYRHWIYWNETLLEKHMNDAPLVPNDVVRVVDAVTRAGGHVSVDEAKQGKVYVDPLLYVSAVPMWISLIPGLRWLRRCVAQWGDEEFEEGGFAERAARPL
jgi:hypothetical protein